MYYHVLQLHLNEPETSNFYKVKELMSKFEQHLTYDDMAEIYINLENYCKRMIRKGSRDFIAELFNVYDNEIKKEFYWISGRMSIKFYRSAVDIALKLKKYEWAKEFIEKHKNDLSEENMENTYYYALAVYEFSMKNFEKALEILSKVKYTEVYHKTEMKCFLAAVYYELGHDDTLLAHLDSFRHFLTNDKLMSPDRKEYFSNYVKYVKNLCNLRNRTENADAGLLKRKIEDEDVLHNKEWLIEKIHELDRIS